MKNTYNASNGVSVVMRGNPNNNLVGCAMADLHRKNESQKEVGRNAA